MTYEIVMPQLGLTMTEGSVNSWCKQPGEHVQKGEMLFTVSTDKVDMEVESTASGFLHTVVETGAVVPVGTVIAVLTERADENFSAPSALGNAAQSARKANEEAAQPVNGRAASVTAVATPAPDHKESRPFPASPRARALASTLGIDIAAVTPASGTRIVEADVTRYHESRRQSKPVPMSAAKRITAERTTQSFARAPHFYLGREVNATQLVRLKQELTDLAQKKLGFNVTYTDFLLRAIALALREHKAVNAYWQDSSIVPHESIDVGFAAQTDKGLLVPLIRDTDKLRLFEIASRRKELSDRARSGELKVDELESGSATLSNLGNHAVDWFQAILNPPQSVIVAAGRIAKRPFVIDDQLEVAETLVLSLSADHRVLDGVAAAAFLGTLSHLIEKPLALVADSL